MSSSKIASLGIFSRFISMVIKSYSSLCCNKFAHTPTTDERKTKWRQTDKFHHNFIHKCAKSGGKNDRSVCQGQEKVLNTAELRQAWMLFFFHEFDFFLTLVGYLQGKSQKHMQKYSNFYVWKAYKNCWGQFPAPLTETLKGNLIL